MTNLLNVHSDNIGVISSTMCLIHCLFTPVLFVVQASTLTHDEHHSLWWSWIDYSFLVISFFAVLFSVKNSIKSWVKIALYLAWVTLSIIIINEHLQLIHLWEELIYIPTLSLIGLHFYNRTYCRCPEKCCQVKN